MACDSKDWLIPGVVCFSIWIFGYYAHSLIDQLRNCQPCIEPLHTKERSSIRTSHKRERPSSNPSHTMELPEHIWLNEILPRVPLEKLGVVWCVCKRWKQWRDAIYETISKSNPLYMVIPVAEDTLAAIDSHEQGTPYTRRYRQNGHNFNNKWKVISLRKKLGRLCAVSEGLFCFIAERACSHAYPVLSPLVVGNPITNRWKQLPFPLPAPVDHHNECCKGYNGSSYGAVAMATNAAQGAYKVIILASSSCHNCLAFEFDSASPSSSWAVYRGNLPGSIPGECFSATIVNGKVYYVCSPHVISASTLVAYDLGSHTWSLILSFSHYPIREQLRSQQNQYCHEHRILTNGEMHPPTAALLWPINDDGTKLLVVGSIGVGSCWAYWVLTVDVLEEKGAYYDRFVPQIEMGAFSMDGAALGTCYNSDTNTVWFVFKNQFTPKTEVVAYDLDTRSSNLIDTGPPSLIDRGCYLFFRGTIFNRAYHTPLLWIAPL